tara:strand:- start:71 stop:496 length:426 start_codon:yes stop_codon:yes gene_type:complete
MAVNHDYFCDCGHELRDIVAEEKPKCPYCNVKMQIHFGRMKGMVAFNPHNSGMYGKYHPGFGCVVESYSHKQRLLKQYNVIEAADSVRGSKTHERPAGYNGPGKDIDKSKLPKKEKQLGGWINSPDDIKRLEKEALNGGNS